MEIDFTKPPIITNQKFVDKVGMICPYCESTDIMSLNSLSPEVSTNKAYQQIACDDCGRVWNDVYTLTGFVSCSGITPPDVLQ